MLRTILMEGKKMINPTLQIMDYSENPKRRSGRYSRDSMAILSLESYKNCPTANSIATPRGRRQRPQMGRQSSHIPNPCSVFRLPRHIVRMLCSAARYAAHGAMPSAVVITPRRFPREGPAPRSDRFATDVTKSPNLSRTIPLRRVELPVSGMSTFGDLWPRHRCCDTLAPRSIAGSTDGRLGKSPRPTSTVTCGVSTPATIAPNCSGETRWPSSGPKPQRIKILRTMPNSG